MANRVRLIRKAQNMTLQEVADAVGCSIPFLADVERGRRGAKPETWQRIADALGVRVEDLHNAEVHDD